MKIELAEKILKGIQGKDVELTPETIKKIKEAKETFVSHYSEDPQGFIEKFVQIIHYKTNDSVPFILNRAQQKVIKEYLESNWLAVPKARQLGITTLTNALALHHALFTNNAFVLCLAVKNANAEENLGRIRSMFGTMPKWVQVLLLDWNDKDHFSNKSQWTFRSRIFDTVSTVEVASAASEDSTRGKRVTFAHWTETAFSDVANAVFTSMSPSLRRRPDSKMILESTGNGASGFYYEVCMGKKDGFTPVFLGWFEDNDYQKEGSLDSDEREQMEAILGVPVGDLTDPQLLWYRETAASMGVAECNQEYPNTIEQVFLSTNRSFFSVNAIQKMEDGVPLHFLQVDGTYLQRSTHGPCQVYHTPNPEFEYLISCDASEGVLDPTSIQGFDPDGNEVFHWHEKLRPDVIADVLVRLGNHYNKALLVVESNGVGQVVLNDLRRKFFYPNIFQDEGKLGVRTSVANKPVMLSYLQDNILSGSMKFNNSILVEEMKLLQADTLKAPKGDDFHDDVAMSSALAAWGFSKAPPKRKIIRDAYRDYTDRVDRGGRSRRQFVVGRSF